MLLISTVDFLLNCNTEDKANASLVDAEVIRYFKELDNLPADDKSALLRVIGGFLRTEDFQKKRFIKPLPPEPGAVLL